MNTTAIQGSVRRRTRLFTAFLLLVGALFGVGVATQTAASASVTITTFAGTGTSGFTGDGGAATSAELNQPKSVVTDNVGNVYFVDYNNRRVRKVDTSGNISTTAGDGSWCNGSTTGDVWSFVTGMCYPVSLAEGAGGSAYFNDGGWLDQMWPTGIQAHVAGKTDGSYSPGDGSGFSTNVNPGSAVVGADGKVYFTEGTNSLKVWDPATNQVSTVAGKSGTTSCGSYASGGDLAAGACIYPSYLSYYNNSIYFVDKAPGYHGTEVFRIDLSQSLSTMVLNLVAGSGSWSDYGADGSTATSDGLGSAGPMAIDHVGNIYLGSTTTGALREVDTSGKLWNVTDVGATVNSLAFDPADNLYESEPGNNVIIKVSGLDPVTSKGNVVALGDSVTAGEGINYGFVWNPTTSAWNLSGSSSPTWTNTTTPLGGNFQQCHQSDYAYSRLLQASGYSVYNMACTGATALVDPALNSSYTSGGVMTQQNFTSPTGSVPAQLGSSTTPRCTGCDAANSLFDTNLGTSGVVLMTLGADDFDFADWLNRCYTTIYCGSSDQPTLDSMLTAAETDLRTTITELNNRAGADGYSSTHKLRLVVTDYYNPYGSSYSSSCVDTGHGFSFPGIGSGQQTFIVNGLKSLDNNILAEVQYAQTNDSNLNASLVDLAGLFTASQTGGLTVGKDIMSGHTFCTSDPWAYGASIDYPNWNGVVPAVPDYPAPMHPTPEGQQAIYAAIVQQAGL